MVPTQLSARQLSQAIHRRELSCREVMQAFLAQIARHNPTHNAIVNLQDADGLLKQADQHDAMLAQGKSMGWMPIHLEIKRRDSIGGGSAYVPEGATVRVVGAR